MVSLKITLLALTSLVRCNAFALPWVSNTPKQPTNPQNAISTICSSTITAANSKTETSNVNFADWIADAPNEITEWKECPIEGNIPSYVQGTLIRNGGGVWSTENGDELYSHIFDGLAKIHAYRITSSTVEHQARFLTGNWYNEYTKNNSRKKLPAGIGTGPVVDATKNDEPKTGLLRTIQATMASATIFDNTPVNVWDYSPKKTTGKRIAGLTDAPPRTSIDFHTMDTVSSSTMNPIAKGSRGYEMFITAHPLYAQTKTGDSKTTSFNVAVELGLNGPRVNLVKESSEGEREVVSSFDCQDGIPYCHSFGLSKNFAMVVLQPLRLNIAPDKMVEKGFLRSMKDVDETRIVLIDLTSGNIVVDKRIDSKIYFYHSISQAEIVVDEKGGDKHIEVSLRLCAYNTPDQLTGEHQFMRLEKCRKGREQRNNLHKGGRFCDVICNTREQSVMVEWHDKIKQGFELPVTRYSRSFDGELPPVTELKEQHAHPRYVYAFGAYALGSLDYDNWGLFKYDLQEDKVDAFFQKDSVYLSEPQFMANPDGISEDDGVLLTQAYFGTERETKLLVLDARTMEVLAMAKTGNRAPLDFHGGWIPTAPEEGGRSSL